MIRGLLELNFARVECPLSKNGSSLTFQLWEEGALLPEGGSVVLEFDRRFLHGCDETFASYTLQALRSAKTLLKEARAEERDAWGRISVSSMGVHLITGPVP